MSTGEAQGPRGGLRSSTPTFHRRLEDQHRDGRSPPGRKLGGAAQGKRCRTFPRRNVRDPEVEAWTGANEASLTCRTKKASRTAKPREPDVRAVVVAVDTGGDHLPCLLDGFELVGPTQATQMEVASASGGSGAIAQGTRTGASLSDVTV